VGALALALGAKDDLFFPYIGGTYAATSLYLFLSLAFALLIVLRGRARLAPENEATLRRFLRVFLPLCSLFFFDELSRASSLARLPWPPLLPLAPLALYVFSSIELLGRLRRSEDKPSSERAAAESRAALIAGACLASPLTLRERGVLIELLRGASNADIASRLGISPNTVKNHIYNIFQKTGAGSRSELLFLADRGPSSPDSQPLTIED
jgi:DNA-binding CsgD family transcriptional regulator